jgi:hypothetical protein
MMFEIFGWLKACFIFTSQRCYFLLAWMCEGLLYFSPHMYDCEVLFFACLFDGVLYFSSHMYDCGMLFFAVFLSSPSQR